MSTRSLPSETVRIEAGTTQTIDGVGLHLTRVELDDGEIWVQLEAITGWYQTTYRVLPGLVMNLPGGLRLTMTNVAAPDYFPPVVDVRVEHLIPEPDPASPTTPEMVAVQLGERCFDFAPLVDNVAEFRAQVQLVGDAVRELEEPDGDGSLIAVLSGGEPAADFHIDVYGVTVRVHYPDFTWMTTDVAATGPGQARAIAAALLAHRGSLARSTARITAGA